MPVDRVRIYVDIDDVLAETARGLLAVAASRFDRRRSYDDLYEFELRDALGFDAETHRRFMHAAHEPEVLASFELTPGCVEVLEAWQRGGHEICLVTGRPPTCERATREWLERYRIPFASLAFVDKYGRHEALYGVPSFGVDALVSEHYAFAVEDSAPTAHFLASHGTPVALFTRPWNRSAAASGALRRVMDWAGVSAWFEDVLTSRGKHPTRL